MRLRPAQCPSSRARMSCEAWSWPRVEGEDVRAATSPRRPLSQRALRSVLHAARKEPVPIILRTSGCRREAQKDCAPVCERVKVHARRDSPYGSWRKRPVASVLSATGGHSVVMVAAERGAVEVMVSLVVVQIHTQMLVPQQTGGWHGLEQELLATGESTQQ